MVLLPQVPAGRSFGTLAIKVHRMFHDDSIALTTRASSLAWTSAGLPHLQGVQTNVHTNPVDPSSPLQKLAQNTLLTLIVSCILNPTDGWFCPPQCGLYSFRAQTKVDVLVLLTLALAGESPTCILHEGIHTP